MSKEGSENSKYAPWFLIAVTKFPHTIEIALEKKKDLWKS